VALMGDEESQRPVAGAPGSPGEVPLPGGFLPPTAAPGPPVDPPAGAGAAPSAGAATGGAVPPTAGSGAHDRFSRPAGIPHGGALAAHVPAPWPSRVLAWLIDSVIVGIFAAVILIAGARAAGADLHLDTASQALPTGTIVAMLAAAAIAMLLYAPAVMVRTNGQTLGKLAAGIRVIRTDGRPMDFGRAALREVVIKSIAFPAASTLSYGVAGIADYLWPLWDRERRALHDYVAQTRVVRAR
jgi:uncharacterized RDD family membrane protein YckC